MINKTYTDDTTLYASDINTIIANINANETEIGSNKSDVETKLGNKVDKVIGKSLIDDTEIARLGNVSNYANKTSASMANGNITIDGVETVVYNSTIDNRYGNDFIIDSYYNPYSINVINSGTYAYSTSNIDSKHIGVIDYTSSTNANSGVNINMATNQLILSRKENVNAIIKTSSTLTGITRRIGFCDTFSTTAPTNGIYIEIVDGVITGKINKNGTINSTTTTYTLTANTWYRINIQMNTTGTGVIFTVYTDNSTQVLWTSTVNTANIPLNVPLSCGDICFSSGTTAILLGSLDYLDFSLPNLRIVK